MISSHSARQESSMQELEGHGREGIYYQGRENPQRLLLKSTMIAAMENLLVYDLYDLELTAVKDNTELRKLLIETCSKSIIVIEDIDCSLHLTGQRSKKKEEGEEKNPRQKQEGMEWKKGVPKIVSQVALSGLFNLIDGLWSACGAERLIVFTTNYVEKLDPALVRKVWSHTICEMLKEKPKLLQLMLQNT